MKRTTKAIICAVVMVTVCVGFAAATGSMETTTSSSSSTVAAAPAPTPVPTTDEERFIGTWKSAYIEEDDEVRYYVEGSTEIADIEYATVYTFKENGDLLCVEVVTRLDTNKVLKETPDNRTYVCLPEDKMLIIKYSDGNSAPPKDYTFSDDAKTLTIVDGDGFWKQVFTKQ